MLGFGPIGWIAGSVLMTIGIGTTAFGVNEVVSGIVGENSIRDWMGDGLYDGLYLGFNIGSAIGSFVGNIYMSSSAGRLAHEIQQNAKHWDNGTFITRYGSLKYHYRKHGGNISVTKYTQKALDFATRNSLVFKYTYNYKFNNATWYLNYCEILGGYFNSAGKIISFWWFK